MAKPKKNVLVFASGNGSNFQAIVDACEKPRCPYTVKALITNVGGCYATEKATNAGLTTICVSNEMWPDRVVWERSIVSFVQYYNPDIICLAGFMKILSPMFFEEWTKPVLNIHPSLLPDFKGLNAVQQALDAGVRYTGCTVHYVDETLDGGEIIGQKKVYVSKKDTLETLTAKIIKQEHILYPKILRKVARLI